MIPDWFKKLLFDTDPNLVVYWNPFKGCHMIDRRVEGEPNTHVLTCKADNGDLLPLNENIIDRLRSLDVWKKFGSYEAFHAHNLNMEAEAAQKAEAEIKENYRLASLDDKVQLNRAHTLTQRHDTFKNQSITCPSFLKGLAAQENYGTLLEPRLQVGRHAQV